MTPSPTADKREELVRRIMELLPDVTPGPWEVYDGCSWRRVGTARSVGRYDDCAVIAPTKASDGHPDLTCSSGNDRDANLAWIALLNPENVKLLLPAPVPAQAAWREALEGFAKELIRHAWEGTTDGDLIQEAGLKYGLLKEVEFDPAAHDDPTGYAEKGDRWYVFSALLSASPAAPAAERMHGPFGWLNGHRALNEDSWSLESDPLENNEEYFAIPLYALVDPFKEIGKEFSPSATLQPSQEAPDTAPVEGRPVCRDCKGTGTQPDYVGHEMRCVEVECSRCKGSGVEAAALSRHAMAQEVTGGVVEEIPRVNGRDVYEVANQLGGYVGPDTPDDLAEFLLKEERAAADLADEIVRLRAVLASLSAERPTPAGEGGWQPLADAKRDGTVIVGRYWRMHDAPKGPYPGYVLMQWDELEDSGWMDPDGLAHIEEPAEDFIVVEHRAEPTASGEDR